MPKPTAKRSAGRPKAEIDWIDVAEMIESGVKAESVATILGISVDTLYIRCKSDNNVDFSAFCQQNRQKGDRKLYTKQYELAVEGDRTMLVWLGKNRLGQADKSEVKTSDLQAEIAKYFAQQGVDEPIVRQVLDEMPVQIIEGKAS